MITRTFAKNTYLVKGITGTEEIKSFELTLWEFEIPKGKKALNDLFKKKCKENGLELFKAVLSNTDSEVRGVSEAEFFKASVHVDR